MTLFEQYLAANRTLTGGIVSTGGGRGTVLIDAMQGEIYHLYGIMKTGIIFAALEGLTPVAYPSERATRKQLLIIRSLCGRVAPVRLLFLKVVLLRFPKVAASMLRLRNKRDVMAIEIDGCKVGPYIYDSCYRPQTDKLTLMQRIRIAYLLFCHYTDRAVIDNNSVKLVLISDPAWRTGMLFELCRATGIKCINAINVDSFQMHKYFEKDEFQKHYRDVPTSAMRLAEANPAIDATIEGYFNARFHGAIQHHDVLRAFGGHQVLRSKEELCRDYGLNPDLPLVFVMAHVLTDAPHAHPPMLYLDYEEWIVRTVLALAKNERVNFLVKEHPSVELFGEDGILGRLLDRAGCRSRLLRRDLHTLSVISSADAVITCGGTIGIEASTGGIPVVLAARPQYAGKGFTIEPNSITEYENLLAAGIERLPRLTDEQLVRAKRTAYVMFELFNNDAEALELGRVPFVRGQPYDEESHYRNIIKESQVPLRQQRMYQILERFYRSADTSIINYDKLRVPLGNFLLVDAGATEMHGFRP